MSTESTNKDVVLFVNAVRPATFKALQKHYANTKHKLRPVVLVNSAIQKSITVRNGQLDLPEHVEVIVADLDSAISVRNALKPIQDHLFAVTSQYENSIFELAKLVPYLPYMPMPTERSLEWGTEKKSMRDALLSYDPTLVPTFTIASDAEQATIDRLEQQINYPMVVKPSGLEGSLLVSYVKNQDQLRATLRRTIASMQEAYDTWIKRQKPAVIVESFMQGAMYSIDTYVDQFGICRHTPPVRVVTGREVGFDDFFGYMITVPSGLSKTECDKAESAAERACHALGLRSVTAHIELMHTPEGWKIIELGPRIGGFRHDIYEHGYGINHIVNDIRNRAGEYPEIPRSIIRHAATFDIYAKSEGVLASVEGITAVRQLASHVYLRQDLKVGDYVKFAKHNGDPVINLMLSHPDKAQFDADVAAMERLLVLTVAQSEDTTVSD